jgi:hypothetical protein
VFLVILNPDDGQSPKTQYLCVIHHRQNPIVSICSHWSTHLTITIGHTRSSQSVTVFTNLCLVAASNGGCSPYSGLPNCSRPQLSASHSNNWTPAVNLTHSLTHKQTDCLQTHSVSHSSKSDLLYDGRFTANEFVLTPSPLRIAARDSFVTEPSLTRRCICPLWIYSMNYIYYYYLFKLQISFARWQWYYNKTQHTNTHITQNYTNNKGHTSTQYIQWKYTYTTYNNRLFLDNGLTVGSKVISLTCRPPFIPQEDFSCSFLLETESTPRVIVRLEPATFRLVA